MMAAWGTKALVSPAKAKLSAPVDSPLVSGDTAEPLPYPFTDQSFDPTDKDGIGGLHLSNPSNVTDSVTFNPRTNEYEFQQKIGKQDYRYPSTMTLEEYMDYDMEKSLRKNWKAHTDADSKNKVEDLNKLVYLMHLILSICAL